MHPTTTQHKYHQKRTAAICLAFLLSFLSIALLRSSFHTLDLAVDNWTPTIQTPAATSLMEGVAIVFDTTSLVFISLAIAFVLFLKHRKDYGLFLLGAMGGDALLVTVIKAVDEISRPANSIMLDKGFSFPSGHSAAVVVFVGMFAFFAWQHWSSARARAGIVGVYAALVAIVGFDRIYLNAHWISDVFGGWLFGAFWLSLVILVYGWFDSHGIFQTRWFNLAANVLFVLAVVVVVLAVLFGFAP